VEKTFVKVILLLVCLTHTTELCYASDSPQILKTRNWQLETDYEGLKGGGSILANTFTFGYSDQWGWTDSTQYQGFEYDVSRFSASVARGATIGLATAGVGSLAAGGSTAAQVGYGGILAANVGYGGYQVGSGFNSIADGNYLQGTAQIAGGGLALVGYLKGGLPQTMTHYTTSAGAQGIAQSGTINGGLGIVGKGVYMTTVGRPNNLFVPKESVIPITLQTPEGTLRIIPRLIYFKPGNGVPLQ